MRAVCNRLEGAFTLLAVHADAPGVVVGARRNSPLVVGRGDGANFLGSDVAAFIEHTREAIELGPGPGRHHHRGRPSTVTDFDGAPAQTTEYHVDWDASAAEKGGYPNFMIKEIDEQPQAVADTLLGRTDADGHLVLDELRIARVGAARGRQDRGHRLRHLLVRRPGRQVRHRALVPDARPRSSWPASSATATRW